MKLCDWIFSDGLEATAGMLELDMPNLLRERSDDSVRQKNGPVAMPCCSDPTICRTIDNQFDSNYDMLHSALGATVVDIPNPGSLSGPSCLTFPLTT